MADFIHECEHLQEDEMVVVYCSHQCNVILLDNSNFQNYRAGRPFEHFGGHYTQFPVRLSVPHTGFWNTVLDLGVERANIRYNISYLKG
jgi:hypothetical protein